MPLFRDSSYDYSCGGTETLFLIQGTITRSFASYFNLDKIILRAK